MIVVVAIMPITAAADTSTISSFTASSQSLSYGYSDVLTWSSSDSGGTHLYFSCVTGVVIKRADTGAVLPCATPETLSAMPSDSVPVSFVNTSGATQTIALTAVPADSNNTEAAGGSQSLSISVRTVPQPLVAFTISPVTASSSAQVVLSWTGVETPGVNFEYDCSPVANVSLADPTTGTSYPCNTPFLTSDLAESGSVSLMAVNKSVQPTTLTVRALPAVVRGTYDATHALSANVTIAPAPAPGTPSVSSFTDSAAQSASGAPITFSWSVANAAGANLEFQCVTGVSEAIVVGTSTTPIYFCAQPAFSPDLPLTGSTTITFTNTTRSSEPVSVGLFPAVNGTYDGIHAQRIQVIVLPPGASVSTSAQPVASSGAVSTMPISNSSAPNAGIPALRTHTFSFSLSSGSRGTEVSALQQFLAEDPSLYPSGLVTGYFGPATLAALQKFQMRYGVAQRGDAGYGLVGPKTRAKLNSISNF